MTGSTGGLHLAGHMEKPECFEGRAAAAEGCVQIPFS